jgi:hypothetical protein
MLSYFLESDALSQLNFRALLAKVLMSFLFLVVSKGDRKRRRLSMEPVEYVCGMETAPMNAVMCWIGAQRQFLANYYPPLICKMVGCKKHQNLWERHDTFLDVSCLYWCRHCPVAEAS